MNGAVAEEDLDPPQIVGVCTEDDRGGKCHRRVTGRRAPENRARIVIEVHTISHRVFHAGPFEAGLWIFHARVVRGDHGKMLHCRCRIPKARRHGRLGRKVCDPDGRDKHSHGCNPPSRNPVPLCIPERPTGSDELLRFPKNPRFGHGNRCIIFPHGELPDHLQLLGAMRTVRQMRFHLFPFFRGKLVFEIENEYCFRWMHGTYSSCVRSYSTDARTLFQDDSSCSADNRSCFRESSMIL